MPFDTWVHISAGNDVVLNAMRDGADMDQAIALTHALNDVGSAAPNLAIANHSGYRSPFDWNPTMRTLRAAARYRTLTWAPLAPGL